MIGCSEPDKIRTTKKYYYDIYPVQIESEETWKYYADGTSAKPHGLWKEYHLNGNLKYSITYNSGLKSGYEHWYYENGNKKSETLYEKDEIIVDTIRWDEKGILIYK